MMLISMIQDLDACTSDAGFFRVAPTNQRTNGQGDSRSWMCKDAHWCNLNPCTFAQGVGAFHELIQSIRPLLMMRALASRGTHQFWIQIEFDKIEECWKEPKAAPEGYCTMHWIHWWPGPSGIPRYPGIPGLD